MFDPPVPLNARSVLELARSCLDDPGEMHILRTHPFADDSEAHDDERLEELNSEFVADFGRCLDLLQAEFGAPQVVDLENEAEDEALLEHAVTLVEGALRVGFWKRREATLYVAIVQPDREAPLLLVLGAA